MCNALSSWSTEVNTSKAEVAAAPTGRPLAAQATVQENSLIALTLAEYVVDPHWVRDCDEGDSAREKSGIAWLTKVNRTGLLLIAYGMLPSIGTDVPSIADASLNVPPVV
jgi:hypothetical protein